VGKVVAECDDAAMVARVELRPASDADAPALAQIQDAQDHAWWGSADGDEDDLRADLDRVRLANDSLDKGSRVAVAPRSDGDEAIVGFALAFEHGHTNVAVDPECDEADEARRQLVEWLITTGAKVISAPSQDRARLALLDDFGWHPTRSSFELHRGADIGDLGPTSWPAGISAAAFRRGIDDADVHAMIYSVWTDVAGHTDRPLEEWQALLLHDASFVPDLVVLARRDSGSVAGVAMCRMYAGGVGWVSQLAVGRPDRGVGLGRSLLIESFHRLVATGAETLALDVEAQNATALGLYRSVGLDVAREWVHCSPQ
jgi:ribosomal protein S18 acetylase RimI-like enzyme